jgi:hypothetical protein
MRPRNASSALVAKPTFTSQTQRRRGQVQVQAFAIVPMVARALTAGVLFYASMNWVYYRGFRKDAEKYMDEFEKSEKSRVSKIEKLTSGKATDNKNQKK